MYTGNISNKIYAEIKINGVTNKILVRSYEQLSVIGDILKMNDQAKLNKAKLCEDLNISYNTLEKRINKIELKKNRKKPSMLDPYEEQILGYLTDDAKKFKSIRVLTEYVNKNLGLNIKLNTMKYWVNKNEHILKAYKKSKTGNKNYNSSATVRFETEPGEQAQFDFKESVSVKLKDGTEIKVNIACLLFSNSRYRKYVVIPDMTIDSVIAAMAMMFRELGVVPKEILFDNAKSIMKVARSKNSEGEVNSKFQAFANDVGFKVNACMARRPQTKGKVESQMRVLEDIYAYNGDLDFDELISLVKNIEDRENYVFHKDYMKVPELSFQKEKEVLQPLNKELLKSYLPQNFERTINKSGLIKYANNFYSVDNKHINKKCNVTIFGNFLIIQYSTNRYICHLISNKRFNYTTDFYQKVLSESLNLPLDDAKLKEIVDKNLSIFNEEEIQVETFGNKWKE